jgi:alpha-amylase/alpha-mannosidase (GH57 family)
MLSKTIAFEDILTDANKLMDRINASRDNNFQEPQLISIATDGETFGHHKKFADRTIAYVLTELAAKNGYKICNYAEYLKAHPPKWEVRIKKGSEGLGTSWSCFHGVGRWKEDCGDTTGGEAGWNQKWRTPLRESLNWLRDECTKVFEAEGSKYLKDVWNARNDYIDIIHERTHHNIIKFFSKHGRANVEKDGIDLSLKLLEMEKESLLMFTSCGWFFADIAGLEAKQILKYACKCIEYIEEVTGNDYESKFLVILKNAKPNDKKYPDSAVMYVKEIKPLAGKTKFDYFKGII